MISRAFNNVTVDLSRNIVIKSSENKEKLKDEINYYLNLPTNISKFFPDLINYDKNFSSYILRYIPHKSLSQLILSDELTLEQGQNILTKLILILDEIHTVEHTSFLDYQDIYNLYINKTLLRIAELKKEPSFLSFLESDYLIINNKVFKNFSLLEKDFIFYIRNQVSNVKFTAIHGDFCFSNILYSFQNDQITLIDPRGSFGTKGIYGHNYYDYAKLLHCLHGKYDLIINNKYELETNNDEYNLKVDNSLFLESLCSYYIEMLRISKIDINFLYIIEASLFLSMSCLHYEDKKRQKALYLNGIILLNNALARVE